MKPVNFLRRRLIWEGPRARTGLKGVDQSIYNRQPPLRERHIWKGLHEQLVRQTYIITLLYDVDRDQFGQGEKVEVQDDEDGAKKDEP